MPRPNVTGTRRLGTAGAVLATMVCLVGGCQQDRAAMDAEAAAYDEGLRGSAVVVNDLCPIGKDPVHMDGHPEELTRTYQGQTVGFCCPGCVEYWDAMTAEAQAEEMAKLISRGHAPGFRPG